MSNFVDPGADWFELSFNQLVLIIVRCDCVLSLSFSAFIVHLLYANIYIYMSLLIVYFVWYGSYNGC